MKIWIMEVKDKKYEEELAEDKTGAGLQFYRWLKKNKYPKAFRVLCHNCNVSYGLYGYCPHTSPSKYGSNAYKDEIQKNKNK